jgi:hypothetical protein
MPSVAVVVGAGSIGAVVMAGGVVVPAGGIVPVGIVVDIAPPALLSVSSPSSAAKHPVPRKPRSRTDRDTKLLSMILSF